jgi:hypothetical protein
MERSSADLGKPIWSNVSRNRMLTKLPPSTRTQMSSTSMMMGLTISGYRPDFGMKSGWSFQSIGTLRTGYPPCTSIKSRQWLLPTGGSFGAVTYLHGSGSRLSARGSSGAAMCPRGTGSRLPPRGSSGAAMCHLGSSTHLLTQGSSGATTCPEDGLCRLQANKQISPGDPTIMISIGACARVSSKTLRDKGCSARSQGVQQATH